MPDLNKTLDRSIDISRNVATVLDRRIKDASNAYVQRVRKAQHEFFQSANTVKSPQQLCTDWFQYAADFAQRGTLFLDTWRERGNNCIAHEPAGSPPLLASQYEILADARTCEHPVEHAPV